MKKSVKLLSIAAAIVAMSASILTTKAADVKEVKLEILNGVNICTGADYDFGQHHVSATDITLTGIAHPLNCVLLDKAATTVQLEIDDTLDSAEGNHVPGTGFHVATTAGTTNGSLVADGPESAQGFTTAVTVYTKDQYKVGELTNISVTIDGLIPGGTPQGVYTGTLNVTF